MSRSDGYEYEKMICELQRRLSSAKKINWLGHRLNTSIAKIDDMILDGATIKEMAKKCRTSNESVSVHLTHLRKVHKIPIKNESGTIRIDLNEVIRRVEKMKPPLFKKPIYKK